MQLSWISPHSKSLRINICLLETKEKEKKRTKIDITVIFETFY